MGDGIPSTGAMREMRLVLATQGKHSIQPPSLVKGTRALLVNSVKIVRFVCFFLVCPKSVTEHLRLAAIIACKKEKERRRASKRGDEPPLTYGLQNSPHQRTGLSLYQHKKNADLKANGQDLVRAATA